MTDSQSVQQYGGLMQAMQKERAQDTLDNKGPLYAALAKAQKDFKPIVRSKTVRVTSDKGSYTFDYAPLESVLEATRDALAANELTLFQLLGHVGTELQLITTLGHSSGCKVYSCMVLPQTTMAWDKQGGRYERPKTAQEIGSAVTYMRRYMAQCILGVNAEEDDDGAQGEDMPRETKAREQPRAAPQPPKVERPKPVQQSAPPKPAEPKAPPPEPDTRPETSQAASAGELRGELGDLGMVRKPASIPPPPPAETNGKVDPSAPASKETREKVNALIKKLGMQKMTAEWCQKVLGKPREQVQLESELLVLLADLEARDGAQG